MASSPRREGGEAPTTSSLEDRQVPDSDARTLDDDERASGQRRGQLVEPCRQRCLLSRRSPVALSPKQDDRRRTRAALGENRPKVRIGADDHSVLRSCPVDEAGIVFSPDAQLVDVNSVVTAISEMSRDGWRHARIDQEPHTPPTAGRTRSLTASAAKRRASRISSRSR